jgi:serine/threonine protein kinase
MYYLKFCPIIIIQLACIVSNLSGGKVGENQPAWCLKDQAYMRDIFRPMKHREEESLELPLSSYLDVLWNTVLPEIWPRSLGEFDMIGGGTVIDSNYFIIYRAIHRETGKRVQLKVFLYNDDEESGHCFFHRDVYRYFYLLDSYGFSDCNVAFQPIWSMIYPLRQADEDSQVDAELLPFFSTKFPILIMEDYDMTLHELFYMVTAGRHIHEHQSIYVPKLPRSQKDVNMFARFLAFKLLISIYLLHKSKIIHMCINTQRIAINLDYETGHIKDLALCDLSASHSLSLRHTLMPLTFFPVPFISPEVFFSAFYSRKSDIWSAGVLLLLTLTLLNGTFTRIEHGLMGIIRSRIHNVFRFSGINVSHSYQPYIAIMIDFLIKIRGPMHWMPCLKIDGYSLRNDRFSHIEWSKFTAFELATYYTPHNPLLSMHAKHAFSRHPITSILYHLCPEAIHLISSMLHFSPEKRVPANVALLFNPWINPIVRGDFWLMKFLSVDGTASSVWAPTLMDVPILSGSTGRYIFKSEFSPMVSIPTDQALGVSQDPTLDTVEEEKEAELHSGMSVPKFSDRLDSQQGADHTTVDRDF